MNLNFVRSPISVLKAQRILSKSEYLSLIFLTSPATIIPSLSFNDMILSFETPVTSRSLGLDANLFGGLAEKSFLLGNVPKLTILELPFSNRLTMIVENSEAREFF